MRQAAFTRSTSRYGRRRRTGDEPGRETSAPFARRAVLGPAWAARTAARRAGWSGVPAQGRRRPHGGKSAARGTRLVHALDTSTGQEDVQAFIFLAAERLEAMLDNLEAALAYELVALRQASHLRGESSTRRCSRRWSRDWARSWRRSTRTGRSRPTSSASGRCFAPVRSSPRSRARRSSARPVRRPGAGVEIPRGGTVSPTSVVREPRLLAPHIPRSTREPETRWAG